mgnify:CR=1 FL=1
MPYIKPSKLLQLQIAAYDADKDEIEHEHYNNGKLFSALSMCVVCGSTDCDKAVVHVNNVYVHKEDAATAEPIVVGGE